MSDCTNTKKMQEWIQEPDEANCRPCMLAPVASWYHQELTDQGRTELADELKASTENDPLTICGVLDSIKDRVEEPLRERLKEFDCLAQTFNPDDEPDESTASVESRKEEDRAENKDGSGSRATSPNPPANGGNPSP